ncbi:MAG: bifunctional heptose 7-phosphate kinase/heptose 1-phosphate adenyltransferase [Isosphaeraceae bacterium]
MKPERFRQITSRYSGLRIAVVGDFCLDRYLEIDPARSEISIETGLPVHNVVRVRAQPGGAGTILNNLVALGVGRIFPLSFCGDDGEGYELRRELAKSPGVVLDHFVTSPERRTFTYCKPLLIEAGREPVELNRLDSKNWTPTPDDLVKRLADGLRSIAPALDALIVMEQVDRAETGVVTRGLLDVIAQIASARPDLPIPADSRRGLAGWPGLSFKMNAAELATLLGRDVAGPLELTLIKQAAADLARRNGRPIFATLAERGIVGASPDGTVDHVPALPLRGPIDIVGAGDAVTANLAAALACGASLGESLELAAIASSVVIHQLGTTGTARVADLEPLLGALPDH